MTVTIRRELHMIQADVAVSNISTLVVTLIVRAITGSLCYRLGPRWTYIEVPFPVRFQPPCYVWGTMCKDLLASDFLLASLGGHLYHAKCGQLAFLTRTLWDQQMP